MCDSLGATAQGEDVARKLRLLRHPREPHVLVFAGVDTIVLGRCGCPLTGAAGGPRMHACMYGVTSRL